MEKVILAWSGGKDSAMALYELQLTQGYEVTALLTTITQDYDRISMHGVRTALVNHQAESLGLPIEKIYISKNSSNQEYEARMKDKLSSLMARDIKTGGFGDNFLEDLRKYREDNLAKMEMKGIFPLWKRNTAELAHTFIDAGFKAIITCVDTKYLDKGFAGREFDEKFLSDLPPGVDPCGENGEFHSFVYDGPIFDDKMDFRIGETVLRDDRFYYCDLIPVDKKGRRDPDFFFGCDFEYMLHN